MLVKHNVIDANISHIVIAKKKNCKKCKNCKICSKESCYGVAPWFLSESIKYINNQRIFLKVIWDAKFGVCMEMNWMQFENSW